MVVACLLHSMWGLPGPRIEPLSPALAGRFSITEPPGKPLRIFLFVLRGVLGSQQNWEEVTGIFHIPCALHMHSISSYQHPPPEWKWKNLHQWGISSQSAEFTLGFITSDLPGGSDGKASACNAGDPGLIPGLGRSPGEGNGNPLQHSCLENPMDGGSW